MTLRYYAQRGIMFRYDAWRGDNVSLARHVPTGDSLDLHGAAVVSCADSKYELFSV